MKKTILINLSTYIMILSVFLFNETFRMMFLYKLLNKHNDTWMINFAFIITFIIYGLLNLKKWNKTFNIALLWLVTFIITLIFVNSFFGKISINACLIIISIYLIPFVLICIKLNLVQTKILFDKFIKCYNVIIFLLTLYGSIDYITNGYLQLYMVDKFAFGEFQVLVHNEALHQFRMYSPLGHPLSNANLYLTFYIFNTLYFKYYSKKINQYIILIITIIGLLLSGSKTALILALFLFIVNNLKNRKKIIYYLILGIILTFAFNSEMFKNNLMQRFEYGIENNNLSSGRNELLKEIITGEYPKPQIFKSGGVNYSRSVAKLAMMPAKNFEYPIIMMVYDYGILETSIMYFLICVYPIMVFIKNKNYFILVNFLCLTFYVNSNNGLANFSDSMVNFCFLTMMLINLSKNKSNLEKQFVNINEFNYESRIKG